MGSFRSTMIYLLFMTFHLQQTLAVCPEEKTVGGTCYTRVAFMDTSEYGCTDGCTYKKSNDEESDKHYCFKKGSQSVSLSKCATGALPGEQGQPSDAGKIPLGGIIPWVNKIEKDGTTVDLPSGFQRCDGTTIQQPSIWAGKTTPNLNFDKRFLRGGSDDEVLTMEDDQMQDHEHIDNGHEHSASSSTPPHDHGFTYKQSDWYMNSCDMAGGSFWCWKHSIIEKRTDKTNINIETIVSKAQSNIGGVKSSYRTGSETRPRNMNIIYIMRVF